MTNKELVQKLITAIEVDENFLSLLPDLYKEFLTEIPSMSITDIQIKRAIFEQAKDLFYGNNILKRLELEGE